jgi:hypothetical protein
MFRILTILGLFGLFMADVQAQAFPYQFSYTNEAYAPLSNATVLNNNAVWNDEVDVPLGFTFLFDNQPHTAMFVLGYSGALLPVGQYDSSDTLDAIFGYTVSAGVGPVNNTIVRYKTDGTAPNRIFKFEMANAGFEGGPGQVSFQIWLYETSNAIQIRLGSQTVPNPGIFFNGVSPLIGYMLNYYYISDDESVFPQAQFVAGTPGSPQDSIVINGFLNEGISDGPLYGMSALPLNNSVFTFTPGTVSTRQPELTLMQLLPNPAVDFVQLSGLDRSKSAQVQLLDTEGKLLRQLELPAGDNTLRLPADLPPGAYVLRYVGDIQMAVSRFIKG